MALPGVTEKLSHGSPAFFAKAQFVALWTKGHHEHDFVHMWCAAPPGAQEDLVSADPSVYFRPPYVGGRGWVGVRLDCPVDWGEIETICEDAYRAVAPKSLIRQLDADS
ncbi:MAG: MmcQ/YjbR family DNA-binding protein [Acidimicrobiales bacterium]